MWPVWASHRAARPRWSIGYHDSPAAHTFVYQMHPTCMIAALHADEVEFEEFAAAFNKASQLAAADGEADANCLGWAARDTSTVLSPFKFKRRGLGPKDVFLKITHAGGLQGGTGTRGLGDLGCGLVGATTHTTLYPPCCHHPGMCHSDLHTINGDWGPARCVGACWAAGSYTDRLPHKRAASHFFSTTSGWRTTKQPNPLQPRRLPLYPPLPATPWCPATRLWALWRRWAPR